ncbi:hypothetical protein KKA14_04880 [bacterium]|nr:hypothetical protein [bacterium]
MKRRLLLGLLFVSFMFPFYVSAIELIYVDNQGFRHYSCGVDKRGGKVSIKPDGKDRYLIRSKKYSGIMVLPESASRNQYCSEIAGAVRIICGDCEMPSEEGALADKKKKLGLYDTNKK